MHAHVLHLLLVFSHTSHALHLLFHDMILLNLLISYCAGFASTLCKYDLRKGDLFVLSWARVRRVRWGSLSSELLMCGGGVHSILLLHLVARCLKRQ